MEYNPLGSMVNRKIGYGIVQPGQSVPDGVPVIKVNNLISGLKSPSELDTTARENEAKYSRTRLHGGELIVSVVGTIGKTAIVPKSFAGCNLVRATALIDIEDELMSKWVKYYFDSPCGQSYIEQNLNTTVQPTLNIKSLVEMPIPIRDTTEMEKTVLLLSALDEKIEVNRQINDNLHQQAATLFKALFVDLTPFDGTMPPNWTISTLGDATEMGAGGDKPKESSPVKTPLCPYPIYSNGINDYGLYGYTNDPKIKVESVTVSARGTIGYVCLRHTPYVPIVRLVTLIPDTKVLSAKYLYLYLRQLHITGTGTTQQQLTVPDFRKTEIIIPDKNTMDSFTETVTPLFEQIWANEDENTKLAEVRDALLPKLMSGEIDVSDIQL